jgi:biotin transport system substrate-specific component
MRNNTYRLVYTGIFAVLLAICSWISIPTVIPFTLQTFGVFLTVLLLGGRQGSIAISIYLLLGAVGIPVFSNFGAGIGYLLGNTGGYAIGFLFIGLTGWLFEKIFGRKPVSMLLAMILGLLLCYTFGTFWFMNISMKGVGVSGWISALAMCVFPFILPDLCKLILAYFISKRLKPMLY